VLELVAAAEGSGKSHRLPDERLKVAGRELSPVEMKLSPKLNDFELSRTRRTSAAAAWAAIADWEGDVQVRGLHANHRANRDAGPLSRVQLFGDPTSRDVVVKPLDIAEGH